MSTDEEFESSHPALERRRLGSSSLKVSTIGFGCGGVWGSRRLYRESEAIALVHHALERGVNLFDTGASYSGGNAENRLGKALRGRDKSNLVIGTKAGTVRANGGRLAKNFSRGSILRQVEGSRRKLGLETIPLLQLHAPSITDINTEVLDTLDDLKHRNWIHLSGASCDGDVLDAAIDSERLDVVMLTYNVLYQLPASQISRANSKGIGVLIKSPLAHSLYSNRIWKIRRAADVWYLLRVLKNYRKDVIRGRRYRFLNNLEDRTGHQAALSFALHPDASAVMVGTTRLSHMDQNLDAFRASLPEWVVNRIQDVGSC